MYLNYYSKMRNSLNAIDIDKEISKNKGKIVTKVVNKSTLNKIQRGKIITAFGTQYDKARICMRERDIAQEYHMFKIPKASGGFRTISAPNEELKQLQTDIVKVFEKNCRILPHNAAHAYVKHRNTLSELHVHQTKEARWFLKLDIKNFFDNCINPLVITALHNMHPVSVIFTDHAVRDILAPCFLNGRLPQGAPSSPFLSNIVMMQTDYAITKALPTLTYTRYADDMLFSSATKFDVGFVVGVVSKLLPIGMQLNQDKTRFGSCNGANWNVGLMYNKDLDITVGYRNKKLMKNMLHNYFTHEDSMQDKLSLKGLLNYYRYIEPKYFNDLIAKYEAQGYTL